MSIRSTYCPPVQRSRAIAHAATAVVSAAAGWWWAHTPAPAAAAQPAPATAAAPIASPAYTAPLVALSSDGNVTLRVEQQPLQWVLEQIALQGGGAPAKAVPAPAPAVAVATVAPAPASCPPPAAPAPDPARVLSQIESGSDAERFQALMLARSAAIPVPAPTLKLLYETSASERVQVAAFEAYLALQADRPDALRAALEAAQHAPAAAVQREAGPRLAQLREVQRLNALPALTDP